MYLEYAVVNEEELAADGGPCIFDCVLSAVFIMVVSCW